jgi:hypothetical protein
MTNLTYGYERPLDYRVVAFQGKLEAASPTQTASFALYSCQHFVDPRPDFAKAEEAFVGLHAVTRKNPTQHLKLVQVHCPKRRGSHYIRRADKSIPLHLAVSYLAASLCHIRPSNRPAFRISRRVEDSGICLKPFRNLKRYRAELASKPGLNPSTGSGTIYDRQIPIAIHATTDTTLFTDAGGLALIP